MREPRTTADLLEFALTLADEADTIALAHFRGGLGAETKPALKTTEFVVYVLAVVGVLLASTLVGDTDGRGDVFLADQAWFYVTLLTIGYMISRGLAKAGSRARRDA